MACVGGKQWYFFNLRDLKYATGQRTNRATLSGYWKATGKDRQVARKGALVGMRKTLVFYHGRAPKGRKTDWVMHEFRMEGRRDLHPNFSLKEDWVLCRVVRKSKVGMCSKPANSESCYDDTGSSFLPALTDTYITFDQTIPPPRPINLDGSSFTAATTTATFEQVPCFSNFTHIPCQQFIPMTERNRGSSLAAAYLNPVLPCDDKVIKSVLDHLSKLKGNHQQQKREEVQPSLAQASCESYLTETAPSSSMWCPF